MFTDIEGSTQLLHELGQDGYRDALADHRRVVREAFDRHEGYEVDYEGDAFFYAFSSAEAAVGAVSEAMRGLEAGKIRIRVGIHTGEPGLDPPKYVGLDVHFAARVMSAGHGGQVLLSRATRELVEVDAIDLGEYRLKDIDGAVSLFQLGGESFPPLKTISNTNLPRPASSFVGREREVEELVALVRGGARLVTLTGPGGSGKTRLGIEAAAELVAEFKAGVFWVGLATLRDPALVLETIAQTLGAKQTLLDYIGERGLLLLLDNLEQVIESAPDLAVLVEACPNLVLLVTSRELLRLRGEVDYQVLPLADQDAVELFCARAGIAPSPAVGELCRRLDNMPLALELASARAGVLRVEQILDRLGQQLDLFKGGRDADPRQRTLRATIEWSYDLLARDEQELFAGLSVFAGGCTLEAALAIADADLDALQSLVEKSLVRRTADRFWMLETIREFALERLQASGEAETLQHRHATHFLGVAETMGVKGAFELHAQELEPEHDNFRSALVTLRQADDSAGELRLCAALGRFWYRGRHLREGLSNLDEALGRTDALPPSVTCEAHSFASAIAGDLGDLEGAERHALAQLELAQRCSGAEELADALITAGNVALRRGNLAAAKERFQASLDAAQSDNYAGGAAGAILNLTELALIEGDFTRAAQLAKEGIRRSRSAGWTSGVITGLITLAQAWIPQLKVQDACAALREAAEVMRGGAVSQLTEGWLQVAGETLATAGKKHMAAKVLGSAAAARENTAYRFDQYEARRQDRVVQGLREALAEDFDAAWSEGACMTIAESMELVLGSLD